MAIVFPTTKFPEMKTDRLILRQLVPADNYHLLAIRSNADINRFIGRINYQNIDTVNEFIEARKQDILNGLGIYWGIELKSAPGIIGTICYWNIEYNTQTTEIGYELLPAYQGKGIMQEALESVLSWGFSNMVLNAITACLSPQNEPSVKLLIRNGFCYIDTIDALLVYKLTRAEQEMVLGQ